MRRLPLRSPPRMRGKGNLLLDGQHSHRHGDHPRVCGEKRLSYFWERRYVTDHPRVCGEKAGHETSWLLYPIGSPPRVRGKVACQGPRVARYRITPAYAGKRGHRRFGPGTIRDHPRVCGEKSKTQPDCLYPVGSPPRMRGKVNTVQVANKSGGWDHPRVCGEKSMAAVQSGCTALGSPPRMRGKVFIASGHAIAPKGITPAYAGKRFTLYLRLPSRTGITPACAGKRV